MVLPPHATLDGEMLTRFLVLLYFAFSASAAVKGTETQPIVNGTVLQGTNNSAVPSAQATNNSHVTYTFLCAPGRETCIVFHSNITIGQKIVDKEGATMHFLPGKYPVNKNQQAFLAPPVTISSSPGFDLSSAVQPFEITLQPGLVVYSDQSYNGQGNFISLRDSFSNGTIPLPPGSGSIAISKNVWVAIALGSPNFTIFYDTAPLFSWPSTDQSITVIDYQSSTCQPQCSGNGVCTASGKCACAKGFTGSLCESCASGFFGPACKPCPSTCDKCDQTSGLCSTPKASIVNRAQETCNSTNCLNGECSSDGECSCLPGWTNATDLNGVTCAQCAQGFFSTSGNCQKCQLGCSKCEDDSGQCTSCLKGFKQNSNDRTKCDPMPTVTPNSTCPSGSYSTGQQCKLCTPPCETCIGPSNCITCLSGNSNFNGKCVAVSSDGVCEGTNGMIANNNKKICDACPAAKCKSCNIPNFTSASTIDQAQCSSCLAGSVPKQGKCDICPSGNFISGSSCQACSKKCKTCTGSADSCLICTNQLSTGKCADTCPHGTFNTTGVCVPCHSDCATCSGPSFKNCLTCHTNRPVLTDGRCLRTCSSQTQYFSYSKSSCQACDSSCSSCSGASPSQCLACSNSTAILRNGGCSSPGPGCLVLDNLGMCFVDQT